MGRPFLFRLFSRALFLATLAGTAHAAPRVVATIALADPVRWDYVSVDAAAHRLYVAHRERVDVIDASSGRLLQTVPAGRNPDAIVYDPVTHRVFAFNGKSSDITAIDARSLKVLAASIPAPGTPEFAVADGHGRVDFNIEDRGEVAVLDAQALKIERHYRLDPCEEPSGLAVDPQGRLYSVCRNGVMVVSDPAQGRVIGQAPIGRGPDGVAWLDGKAYSANGRDGTVSVVTAAADGHFEAIATVPTALGARTIAADPGEHALFLPTADFKPQPASGAVTAGRPEAIAGTFRVLVLKDGADR